MTMRYEIKFADINTPNVTKKTISFFSGSKEARKVKTDIAFDNKVNGGQGAFKLALNEKFNSAEVDMGDLITIRNFNDNDKVGVEIYYGYVETLDRIIDERSESIELGCQGILYLMRDILYKSPSAAVTKNDDPTNIQSDIVTQFNTNYPFPLITFDVGNPLFGKNINISFENDSSYTALLKVNDITDWVFFVGADGVFRTKPKTATVDNILIFQKEITKISLSQEREDIQNRLILAAGAPQGTQIYEDIASQNQFGLKESFQTNNDLLNNSTQDDFGNNFIIDNANPKQRLKLELNINTDFNALIPGNLIRVKNIDATIADVRIVRTVFSSNKFLVDCEKTETLGEAIVNS